MKTILAVALIFALLYQDPQTFCDGYKEGYIAASTYERSIQHYRRTTPECPAIMHWEYTYNHGYIRGLLDGLENRGYLTINK